MLYQIYQLFLEIELLNIYKKKMPFTQKILQTPGFLKVSVHPGLFPGVIGFTLRLSCAYLALKLGFIVVENFACIP